MSPVLVTGAAGFIGSHLSEALLAAGRDVVGVDSLCEKDGRARKLANLARLECRPGFSFARVDVRDVDGMRDVSARARPEHVVHLAALAGVRDSLLAPDEYVDVNVRGLSVLLKVCGAAKSVVFASSSSVYGERVDTPFRESDPTDRPASPYAATKKAGELLLHAFFRATGVPVTCLRLFTVYGPRQRPGMAIEKFARLIRRGEPIQVFGGADSARDYTYSDDVVDGILRSLDTGPGFRVVNLGSGRPIRLDRLVTVLEDALGRRAVVERVGRQKGDVEVTHAATDLARRELGWEPGTSIEEGIRRYVSWLRSEEP